MIVCENKKCALSYSFKKGSLFETWLFRTVCSDGSGKHYFCDPKCYHNQKNIKVNDDTIQRWKMNRENLLSELDFNHKFTSHKQWFHDNYVNSSYEEVN